MAMAKLHRAVPTLPNWWITPWAVHVMVAGKTALKVSHRMESRLARDWAKLQVSRQRKYMPICDRMKLGEVALVVCL